MLSPGWQGQCFSQRHGISQLVVVTIPKHQLLSTVTCLSLTPQVNGESAAALLRLQLCCPLTPEPKRQSQTLPGNTAFREEGRGQSTDQTCTAFAH